MNIAELLNINKLPSRKYNGSDAFVMPREPFGLEIEAEKSSAARGIILSKDFLNLVSIHDDGSLKVNGNEFVFSSPLFGEDAILAIDTVLSTLKETGAVISKRCSLHAHINVTDMDKDQVITLILLSIIFEKIMFDYIEAKYGINRSTGLFCRPFYNTDGMIGALSLITRYTCSNNEIKRGINAFSNEHRYHAININSILKFGSLEYRHHPGTLEKEDVIEWVNVLMSLKLAAITMVEQINMETLSKMGAINFMATIFRTNIDIFTRYLSPESITTSVYEGVRIAELAQNYLIVSDNWDAVKSKTRYLSRFNELKDNLYINFKKGGNI